MRRWLIGIVAADAIGLATVMAWAQATQQAALTEKSTISLTLLMYIGTLVMGGVGAFIGGRIAFVRVDQKLEDHCETQKADLSALATRLTDMEHVHRDCPARERR